MRDATRQHRPSNRNAARFLVVCWFVVPVVSCWRFIVGRCGISPNSEEHTADASRPLEPLLRWAGGKRQIVARIRAFLPPDIENRVYREPFAGAACLFFSLQPTRGVLSDANAHLIDCYRCVRDHPGAIATYLAQHAKSTCESYYYRIRAQYNAGPSSTAQAARFIYLNKTCFNGIFRVNIRGLFNVPYGFKEPPALPTHAHLLAASRALQSAELRALPFEEAVADARDTDFVYLDPPYPPLNGTSYFTHYTADRFGKLDQKRLATIVRDLDARGCKFLMSNADTAEIRRRYAPFEMRSLSVTRFITCKAKRHRVSELVVANYPLQ